VPRRLAAGGALAFAVASAGADAPMTASITAKDPYNFDNGSGGNSVTIAKGGSVTFSYPPGGGSSHNVVFGAGQPTSCTDMPAAIAVTALVAKRALASRARLVKVGSLTGTPSAPSGPRSRSGSTVPPGGRSSAAIAWPSRCGSRCGQTRAGRSRRQSPSS
jgi:hypothetical protein